MAGNDNRNRIAVVCHPNSAKSIRFADGSGDVRISASLAVRDCQQCAPACELEIGSAKIEWETELAASAREIFFELTDARTQGVRRNLERGSFFGCTCFLAKVSRVGTDGLLSRQTRVKFEGDQAFF